MDIDSPPRPSLSDPHQGHHHHITLPSFSASFPLPFRVLFLVGLAQLLWATNLHILHVLGLDTSWILDIRDPDSDGSIEMLKPNGDALPGSPTRRAGVADEVRGRQRSEGYMQVYKLFCLYTLWVGGGWVAFRLITGGETELMERWRGLIGVVALGAVVGALAPWRGVAYKERTALRRAIKRIVVPIGPVYFSDVILADIMTSFAKVLGDLWISSAQIVEGGVSRGRVGGNNITLAMVCLPYALRFRQCISEYLHSPAPRPLLNALKYFSAFPVILLSAAQKTVVLETAALKGVNASDLENRWFGEHRIFRLWLLAVVVNSMYSFYWDVSMDWGLALCDVDTWIGKRDQSGGGRRDTFAGRIRKVFRRSTSVSSHQRSPCPTPAPGFRPDSVESFPSKSRGFFAFGLRPTLLLPDPMVYHLFTIIDLVLRFTWSLKLSSHLHTISEIESGVFMMEALELMRRWMWVFVRVEWEAVKMGENRVIWETDQG